MRASPRSGCSTSEQASARNHIATEICRYDGPARSARGVTTHTLVALPRFAFPSPTETLIFATSTHQHARLSGGAARFSLWATMGAHKHAQQQATQSSRSSDAVRKRHVLPGGQGAAEGAPSKLGERTFSDDGMEKVIAELPEWTVSASASSIACSPAQHAGRHARCRAARCPQTQLSLRGYIVGAVPVLPNVAAAAAAAHSSAHASGGTRTCACL